MQDKDHLLADRAGLLPSAVGVAIALILASLMIAAVIGAAFMAAHLRVIGLSLLIYAAVGVVAGVAAVVNLVRKDGRS